jgi:hypothetical protein
MNYNTLMQLISWTKSLRNNLLNYQDPVHEITYSSNKLSTIQMFIIKTAMKILIHNPIIIILIIYHTIFKLNQKELFHQRRLFKDHYNFKKMWMISINSLNYNLINIWTIKYKKANYSFRHRDLIIKDTHSHH